MIKVMILRWRDDCGLSRWTHPIKGSYETESGGSEFKGECDLWNQRGGTETERERRRERDYEVDAITNSFDSEDGRGARSQGIQVASMN